MEFKVDFITKQGHEYSIMTDKLNLPGMDGRRTILSNHMPILLPIDTGVIETSYLDKLDYYAVDGGVVYFKDNMAQVLVSHVIQVSQINIDEAINQRQIDLESIEVEENQYHLKRLKQDLLWQDTLIKAYQTLSTNK